MANKGDHEDNGNDDENHIYIDKTDLLTRAEKVGLRSGE